MKRMIFVVCMAFVLSIGMAVSVESAGHEGISVDGCFAPDRLAFDHPVPVNRIAAEMRDRGVVWASGNDASRAPAVEILDSGVPPEADMPNAGAITPDNQYHVCSFYLSGNIGIQDLSTYAWEDVIAVGTHPTDVDILPSGSHAVVVCSGDDTLVAVNLTTRLVEYTIDVGSGPVAAAVAPDGSRAIVLNSNDQSATIVDLTTWSVQQTVTSPAIISGIVVTSWNTVGRFRYAYSEVLVLENSKTAVVGSDDTVNFIDLSTGTVDQVVLPDGSARELAVSRDQSTLATGGTSGTNTINLIDLTVQPPVHQTGFDIGNWNYNTQTITFSQDGSLLALVAYPSSGGYSYLFFFDITTQTSVYQCPTHMGGCGGMALSPDGTTLIASGYRTLYVDMSGAVPAEIGSDDAYNAEFLAAAPGNTLAVTGTSMLDENIYIWDYAATDAGLLDTSRPGIAPEGDCPRHVVMSPDGATCVCSDYASDSVSFIDMASRTVVGNVDAGDRPTTLAMSSDGNTAICCNYETDNVIVIDMNTQTVVADLPSQRRPGNCVISPDGTRAYAVSVGASPNDFVSVYDLAGGSSQLVAHLDLGVNLYGFYILGGWTPNPVVMDSGDYVVIPGANPDNKCAVIVDTKTPAVATLVDLSAASDMPYFAAAQPGGDEAAVVDRGGQVHFISVAGAASVLEQSVTTGSEPFQAAYSPDGQYLFVSDLDDETVDVIDCSTYQIVKTINLPGAPDSITTSGNTLFVSCAVSSINPSFNLINMAGPDSSLTGTYEREYYGFYIAAAENPLGTVTNCPGFDKLALLYSEGPQPTSTPTPDPTATPTITPTATPDACQTTGVTIEMPDTMFSPGEICSCTAFVCNRETGPLDNYPLFVILDVYGSLFFAPSYNEVFDTYLAMYPSFPVGMTEVQVLPAFNWPDGAGSADSIFWYGALTNPEMSMIFGDWDVYEFGWTE